MDIRPERAEDIAAVRAVHRVAFGRCAEADLVDALRDRVRSVVSLVADEGGAGLAPLAVLPASQRKGIGSALVHAGLTACADLNHRAIVVLGHPAYYHDDAFAQAGTE